MKNQFRISAWAGIIAVAISVIAMLISLVSQLGAALFSVAGTVATVIYLYGFVVLGKKHGSALLTVMTWIGIAIYILFAVGSLIFTLVSNLPSVSAQADSGVAPVSDEFAVGILALFLVLWVIFSIIFGAYYVLFGIGLLKISDKVKHARAAGILSIVGGATLIIFVGLFVLIAAFVMKIILLFNAAKGKE